MSYVTLYLQIGGAYLTVLFLIFLVDAFVLHNPRDAITAVLGRPYGRHRDILTIAGKAALQVVVWPFVILLFMFVGYDTWKERRESSRRNLFRGVASTTFYERKLDPERRHIGFLGLQLDGGISEDAFTQQLEKVASCPRCLAGASTVIQKHYGSSQKTLVEAFTREHEGH